MTKPQEPTAAIRGTWPLPVDRFSWLVAGLLLVLLIFVYYAWFYPRLEAANNSAHIFSEPQHTNAENEVEDTGLELKVASPRYISDLTRQTLLLGVTYTLTNTKPISIKVVPSLRLLCVRDNSTGDCGEDANYYVFLDTPDDSQPTLQQGGYLLFTNIPSGANVSQELTVEVVGLTQALGDEAEPGRAQEDENGDEKVEIKFAVFDVTEDSETTDSNLYSPKDPLWMDINSTGAVVQGIMSFLLLPPWANGFIPFVAVFIAVSYTHLTLLTSDLV